jgi:hypothetical protein
MPPLIGGALPIHTPHGFVPIANVFISLRVEAEWFLRSPAHIAYISILIQNPRAAPVGHLGITERAQLLRGAFE